MGLIYLILVGSVLGWLAAIMLKSEGLKRNCLAGIGGALVAGLLISPLFGNGNLASGGYSVDALVIGLLGSVAAIASANLLHRRAFR